MTYWQQLLFYCRLLRLFPVLLPQIIIGRWIIWPITGGRLAWAVCIPMLSAIVVCGIGVRTRILCRAAAKYVRWFLGPEDPAGVCNKLIAACKEIESANHGIAHFIESFEKAWREVRRCRKGELLHTVGLLSGLSIAIVWCAQLNIGINISVIDKMEIGALLITATFLCDAHWQLHEQKLSAYVTWYFTAAVLCLLLAMISTHAVWALLIHKLIPWRADLVHLIAVWLLAGAVGTYNFIAARDIGARVGQKRIEMWIFGDIPTTLALAFAVLYRLKAPGGMEGWLAGAIFASTGVFVGMYIVVELRLLPKAIQVMQAVGKGAAAGQ